MKTPGELCPVSKAAEILGERWTILIIHELLSGTSRYSEFQRGLSRKCHQYQGNIDRYDDFHHSFDSDNALCIQFWWRFFEWLVRRNTRRPCLVAATRD